VKLGRLAGLVHESALGQKAHFQSDDQEPP
jgi:hypothetical protein